MSSIKKIAVVCNYTLNPERIGGMDRFFAAYDQACKENGCEVKWFFSGGKAFGFYRKMDIEVCERSSIEDCFINFQQQNRTEFEIVVTHFLELCTPFYKKIKHLGRPYIIAVDHNPRPLEGFTLKKRLKNRLKGKLYSAYIDKFIGVSGYTKDQILLDYGQRLSSKTEVIYNGIAHHLYTKRSHANEGRFIVASHLRPSKGIQDLIRAVALLEQQLRERIKIDIFGEGPMEAELKALVNQESLNAQIHFYGSSPELPNLFKNYSFLLQPTYMECFSLSILESLAANVPVITTPVGGNLEIIQEGKNGYIFEPGNIEQLSEILRDVLQQKKTISVPVDTLIRDKYYLEKMVNEHVSLLSLD